MRICSSFKLPGDAQGAHLWTQLRSTTLHACPAVLLYRTQSSSTTGIRRGASAVGTAQKRQKWEKVQPQPGEQRKLEIQLGMWAAADPQWPHVLCRVEQGVPQGFRWPWDEQVRASSRQEEPGHVIRCSHPGQHIFTVLCCLGFILV